MVFHLLENLQPYPVVANKFNDHPKRLGKMNAVIDEHLLVGTWVWFRPVLVGFLLIFNRYLSEKKQKRRWMKVS